tara:strand:+ start:334 stop:480 length:147 start_codon:yes stop_codon:yes gene_type:complete
LTFSTVLVTLFPLTNVVLVDTEWLEENPEEKLLPANILSNGLLGELNI